MINHVSRRMRVTIAAGALGASLVMSLGACSSSGGAGAHNESTAQVCTELQTMYTQMETAILGAVGTSDPTTASADQQAQMITAIKAALSSVSSDFKTEAGKASDAGFSTALQNAASEIDSDLGKLNTIDDLNNLDSSDSSALDSLQNYCPNANFGGE
jgi:hypothetical protein